MFNIFVVFLGLLVGLFSSWFGVLFGVFFASVYLEQAFFLPKQKTFINDLERAA